MSGVQAWFSLVLCLRVFMKVLASGLGFPFEVLTEAGLSSKLTYMVGKMIPFLFLWLLARGPQL